MLLQNFQRFENIKVATHQRIKTTLLSTVNIQSWQAEKLTVTLASNATYSNYSNDEGLEHSMRTAMPRSSVAVENQNN